MTREAEFWQRVEKAGPDECWPWHGVIANNGYGIFSFRSKTAMAHRLSYEWLVGPIPEGLTIDHLCRNTLCMNPSHMEPVSMYENIMRGDCPAAQNARKTHCRHGHEFTPENTVVKMRRGHPARVCRTCRDEQNRAQWLRTKERLRADA